MNAPRLTKWPFYLVDILLLGLAYGIFAHFPHPLDLWAAGLITACVVVAAFLAVWPYRLEYETEVKLFESERLIDATQAIQDLETVAGQIQEATSQWQGVQEHAGKTTRVAQEIADRIAGEARAFSDFMSKANDTEKATLRLEVEKSRRNEAQWLQVMVHMLDHVHALYQAGGRSGQPALAAQLGAFQAACRDVARRVGLTPIDAEAGQDFDSAQHEVVQGQTPPEGPARIAQIIATGFTFQGQIIRRPIVVIEAGQPDTAGQSGLATAPPADAPSPAEEPAGSEPEGMDGGVGETPLASASFDATAEEFIAASVEDAGQPLQDPGESAGAIGEAVADSGADLSGPAELTEVVEVAEVTEVAEIAEIADVREIARIGETEPGGKDEPAATIPPAVAGAPAESAVRPEPFVLEHPESPRPAAVDEFRLESDPVPVRQRRRAGNA